MEDKSATTDLVGRELVDQFKRTVEPGPVKEMSDAWMFVFNNREGLYKLLELGLENRPIYKVGDSVYLAHYGSMTKNVTVDKIVIDKIDISTTPISYWSKHHRWYPEFLFSELDDAMAQAKKLIERQEENNGNN